MSTQDQDMIALQEAYKQKKITFYLGAGVSVANGLPSWEQLVLAMYFSIVGQQKMEGWRPLSNYLFSISEWYLSKLNQPLDITVRKLQKYFSDSEDGEQKFLDTLYQTLYSSLLENPEPIDSQLLRKTNTTLNAVAALCEASTSNRGIKNVITYNYDDFLEISLKDYPYQTVYNETALEPGTLPIYHVHGYMPIRKKLAPRTSKDLVFSEYQYNKVATNPNHWSNQIQTKSMANSVGVMVGVSLSDRNVRRLLYSLRSKSTKTHNYILLKKNRVSIADKDLDEIHKQAIKYYENFVSGKTEDYSSRVISSKPGFRAAKKKSAVKIATKSASPIDFPPKPQIHTKSQQPISIKLESPTESKTKTEPRYRYEIRSIIQKVEEFDWDQQEFVMNELGIKPIWYDNYEDIPAILNKITGA